MSELRARINASLEEALEAGGEYLAATSNFGIAENSKGYCPVPMPPEIGMLVEDALELEDPRTFLPFGGLSL